MPKRDEFKTEAEWLAHLRLWFAGMALQGLVSNQEYGGQIQRLFDPDKRVAAQGEESETPQDYVARLAGAFADAMLKERDK